MNMTYANISKIPISAMAEFSTNVCVDVENSPESNDYDATLPQSSGE